MKEIAHLVEEYGKRANQETAIAWPTNEKEIRKKELGEQN
jgi:hypothetical protein